MKLWWEKLTFTRGQPRKALASLTMLISWTIWNERNARVFRHHATPSHVIIANLKEEAKLWVRAGAKHLGNVIPGE